MFTKWFQRTLVLVAFHQPLDETNLYLPFPSLIHSRHNILTSLNSVVIPSSVCFISLARAPSNYLKYYARSSGTGSAWWGRQISVWGVGGGEVRETQRGGKSFALCCGWSFESSWMWFILPPASPSSLAIPLQRRGLHSAQETKLVPMETDLSCHCWYVK